MESEVRSQRHILHLDMDAFYAAVEQLDRPELRGKPVLVGGSPQGRGVVATASYEARSFGCHSAMPMAAAVRACPQAIVVSPRMERYVEISRQVFEIFESCTPLVEPLSIDEAFLDVTGSTRLLGPPAEIARALKARVRERTQLTVSVGVASNKFLAKLASDLDKPDGMVVVDPVRVQEFLDPLPIGRLWGVGKATQRRLEDLGVRTFADVRAMSEARLRDHFGESGEHFYRLVRGIDQREVVPDREAKSISHELTFAVDVRDIEHLRAVLLNQVEDVAARLRRHELLARTVTLKVRTNDFKTYTRSTTLDAPTDQTDAVWHAAAGLLDAWRPGHARPVRLIGVGVSRFASEEGRQLSLFEQQKTDRRRTLDRVADTIRDRYGKQALSRGAGLRPPER